MDDSTIPAPALQEIKVNIFGETVLIGTFGSFTIDDLRSTRVYVDRALVNRKFGAVFAPIESRPFRGQVHTRPP
jgi:hypothetical protein